MGAEPSRRTRRAAVIANPLTTDMARLRSAVAIEEKENGWQPSVWLETTADDPGQGAAGSALKHDPTVVIVAGGDGTVRAVAETLHSSGMPVAIVPVGTGNLLARNLGVMANIGTSVRTGFTGTTRAIDVGSVELAYEEQSSSTHVFLVMTGVGLDARMATDTNRVLKKRIGWLAYVDPISRSVLGNEQFLLHYRVDDGRERSIRTHTVIVGNCSTLTAGIILLPDAEFDDGLLDVVLLRPKGFWQWLRVGSRLGIAGLLTRTKRGRVILRATPDLRALQYVQGRSLTARFDRPQDIQLDGDSFGRVTAVKVALHAGALNICVPKRTSRAPGDNT